MIRAAAPVAALAFALLGGAAAATPGTDDPPSPTPTADPHAGHGDHSEHGTTPASSPTASPTADPHTDQGTHEHGTTPATPTEPEDHTGHGTTDPGDGVSGQTRIAVLGAFGAVNAAVVGTAFVLRRRDPGRARAHLDRTRR